MKQALLAAGQAAVFLRRMQASVTTEFLPEALSLNTNVLFEATRSIAGSVHYAIKRFARPAAWMGDEKALLRYHYEAARPDRHYLSLRFCLVGNMYCREYQTECHRCRAGQTPHCGARVESVDFISFAFSPAVLTQFLQGEAGPRFSEKVLSFSHTASFTRVLTLCGRTRLLLDGLLNHNYADSRENIFVSAQTQMLLLHSLDYLDEKEPAVINCRFLNNESDRDKVLKAREILLEQIGEPITIKQLSRRVAMNECYLKKGFKELFGTTIFEFYQSQRMEHAKRLLYEKGLSVTAVAEILGYSSISHFSTAFKKQTGLKPCELLLR